MDNTAGHGIRGASLMAALVTVATLATWWAWLGWDTEYQVDPLMQVASGPYEVWQVVGCGLTLVLIAAGASLWTHPWLVAATLTLSFALVWSVQAASSDDSGLWAVGALLLLVGLSTASITVAYGAWLVRRLMHGGPDPVRVGVPSS